jgi:hypothetical protein
LGGTDGATEYDDGCPGDSRFEVTRLIHTAGGFESDVPDPGGIR